MSQSWYNLLSVIGFQPGDYLAGGTILMGLSSPDQLAANRILRQSTQFVAAINTKVAQTEQEKLNVVQQEKDRIAQQQKEALDDAESAKVFREAEQKKADDREAERLAERHRKLMATQEKEAEKARASAAAVKARVDELSVLIESITEQQNEGDDITAEQAEELEGYRNDPIIGHMMEDPDADPVFATVADSLNSIAASRSQLSASQAPPSSTSGSISKSSATSSRQYVDLTYSDDEHDGDDLFMKSQLNKIPWQTYGLTTEVVTPALFALKHMEVDDQQLFSDSGKAWQIISLGIKALRRQEAAVAESSGGSDGSKRTYAMGPGAASLKPKATKKTRMTASAERQHSPSVAPSAKAKGKRRATPVYSASDEDPSSGSSSSNEE
jgi:hypothetical protein